MGFGILNGQPRRYLSRDWYATGERLATWIELEIPCFVGNVPVQYTEAVFSVLKSNYVPRAIILDAVSKLEKRGIRFDWGASALEFRAGAIPPVNRSGAPSAPQMRAVSKAEAARIKAYTFEEYERRYVLAIRTNDVAGAEAIIAAVLQLLWGMAKGYSKTRQAARNEKMVEWEEFNTAVNEALNRAATLQTHIRYLSREDIRSLRDSPTPTSIRNLTTRLATRVTTRSVPRARRARR